MQGSSTNKSRPLSQPAAVLLSAAVWKMRTTGLLLTVLAVVGGAWAQHQEQQHTTEYFTCGATEVCVYWPQCLEGVVNTGGVGLINPRSPVPIPSNYTDPRPCESIGKLCCVHPDKKPEPITVCPLHHFCVPQEQCIDGEINTSGIGLIDPRIRAVQCINPEYPNVNAVCCKRPGPEPLVTCPNSYETCRPVSECDTATGTYDTTAEGCYVDPLTGEGGVCCSPPVLEQCSRGHVCVTYEQCTEQGVVNTDGAGIFNPRIYDRCSLAGGTQGICCKEPPPTTNPVVKCSQPDAVCSPTGYCQPDSLSAPQGYTETCYRTEGSGIIGECCVEPPLPECSAGYSCSLPHQCVETPGVLTSNPSCQINVELVGVCCTKKEVVPVDECPKDSVCLPELLCQGNPKTNVIPQSCKLSGTGYSNPGVCCANIIVDPPIPDLKCGQGNADVTQLATRIKNTHLLDRQTKFAEFPWMGIVFFRNQTYKCGASLVDDRWVLTAAHCVAGFNPYDLRVRLGEYQVDLFDEKHPYEDYDITTITVHPKFNSANLHNDVAVLELDRPVAYRYHINRICLPPPDRIHPAGTECVATGWGKDAFDGGKYQVIMKKVVLPVVPYDDCQNMLRKTRLGLFFVLDKSFVCAGGKADQDACTGDGGGPLMCLNPNSGSYELYGMTAWGIGCGIEGNPGVYVNVPYFMDWVYSIMQPTPEQQQQHSAGPYGK